MKKAISIFMILALIFVGGCGKKQQDNTKPNDSGVVIQDTKADEKSSANDKETDTAKESKASDSVSEFEKMVDEFNSLEDGDPKKEELRKKLQDIFDAAEDYEVKSE